MKKPSTIRVRILDYVHGYDFEPGNVYEVRIQLGQRLTKLKLAERVTRMTPLSKIEVGAVADEDEGEIMADELATVGAGERATRSPAPRKA